MKDSVSVASYLRLSSKGKLKYDRFWVEEGRTQKILQIHKDLTKLHVTPGKYPSDVSHVVSFASKDVRSAANQEPETKETKKEEIEDLPTPASPVQMSLVEYEKERSKQVLGNLGIRCAMLEHNTQLNHQWAEQQMQHMKQNWQLEMQKQVNDILLERDKELQEVQERQQKQKEHNKTKARRLNDRKKEAEIKLRQLEEQQQQKKRDQLELRKSFVDTQHEFHSAVNKVMECLQSQNQNKWLQVAQTDRGHKLKQIGDEMTLLLEKSGDSDLVLEVVQLAQNLLQDVKVLLQEIQSDIVQGNAKKGHYEAQEHLKEQEKLLDAKRKAANDPAETVASQEAKQETSGKSILYQSVSPSALQDYARVIEHQKKWEQSYASLLADIALKKYRFDLQKAVNIPVNAISAISGMHLRDKVQRLCALLSGQTVHVGDKRVSCTSHPQGLAFCLDLLAKKLVTQAEHQVASNHEAAFPLAAVAVSLMNKFPDLTLLLLAHIYIKCPYLVPYYIPMKEGESQEEHYKSLGYMYVDGAIEKQDKFLKRMSGIVRFYGALIHASPMPGLGNRHPHGLSFGWIFLARVLNLCPRVDVTATVLYHFLEVAGNALYGAYSKQFRKLLHVLCKDYFQEIRKVTTGVSGGPLSRLQDFLENTIRLGKIPSPAGVLSPGFWNTR